MIVWTRIPVHIVFGVRDPVLLYDSLWGQISDRAAETVSAYVIGLGEAIPPG